MKLIWFWRFVFAALIILPLFTYAETIHIAVATNFREPAREIVARYQHVSNKKLFLSYGSTGKIYAQIKHGAPFDIFFAADTWRPRLLEEEGLAVAGSRFTYAQGRLVLWSQQNNFVDKEGVVLQMGKFNRLAIANPDLAPYGRAAKEVLQAKGLWKVLSPRIVRGENIGQTFHFIKSGNAELGFIAYSQIIQMNQPFAGSFWLVPQKLYRPIQQQAVLLKDTRETRDFFDFVRGPEAKAIIQAYGYDTK
jgi:molybdate transport system substrate-binding protein